MSDIALSRRSLALGLPLLALAAKAGAGWAQSPSINQMMTGFITSLHDPVMIREGDTWHVFGSGGWPGAGLMSWRTSTDLVTWRNNGPVFDAMASWTSRIAGGNCCWAPDISYVDGHYQLYYAVSTGGSMRSAIGLATSPTLDKASPHYGWQDRGLVLETHPGDGYNAIDPNFFEDADGKRWLAFGSYWSGLKLIKLDGATGKPHPGDTTLYSLAYRPAPDGGDNAIEASFLYRHGDYYYLFASYDHCCQQMQSNYYVACGRSKAVTGPYIDRDGRALMQGYGTSVVYDRPYRSHRFIAPGHCAVVGDGSRDLLVYHAYDTKNAAAPTLRISPIVWDRDGWPGVVIDLS